MVIRTYDESRKPLVNGMEITAPNITVRCGMGEIVCERRDGMGTTGQTVGRETVGNGADSGTGNSRDGN